MGAKESCCNNKALDNILEYPLAYVIGAPCSKQFETNDIFLPELVMHIADCNQAVLCNWNFVKPMLTATMPAATTARKKSYQCATIKSLFLYEFAPCYLMLLCHNLGRCLLPVFHSHVNVFVLVPDRMNIVCTHLHPHSSTKCI